MNDPARHASAPRSPASGGRDRRNRVFWVSIGISALLHLAAVLIYPWLGRPDVGGVTLPGTIETSGEAAGTRVVVISEIAEGDVEAPDRPEEIRELEESVRPALPGAPRDEGAGRPGLVEPGRAGRSAAEILRPQAEDSLIWRGVDPALTELSDHEKAELRMRWALTEWNEAMAAEARAAEEALDWTHTDADGNKWGVSPGKLHLGSLTLPLPLNLGPPPGVNRALDQRLQEYDAIERQAGRARVWQSWEERAKAIRARKDREREEARSARPDTTGSRR